VRRGELRSIIGPNGAGKTTFFRLISGETAPTSGRIWFDGTEITGCPSTRRLAWASPSRTRSPTIFPHLSVLENVRVAVQGYARSFNFWSRADRLTGVRDRAAAIVQVGRTRR
jgi:branched-chain amino acid transport system ATP-binding protein